MKYKQLYYELGRFDYWFTTVYGKEQFKVLERMARAEHKPIHECCNRTTLATWARAEHDGEAWKPAADKNGWR